MPHVRYGPDTLNRGCSTLAPNRGCLGCLPRLECQGMGRPRGTPGTPPHPRGVRPVDRVAVRPDRRHPHQVAANPESEKCETGPLAANANSASGRQKARRAPRRRPYQTPPRNLLFSHILAGGRQSAVVASGGTLACGRLATRLPSRRYPADCPPAVLTGEGGFRGRRPLAAVSTARPPPSSLPNGKL